MAKIMGVKRENLGNMLGIKWELYFCFFFLKFKFQINTNKTPQKIQIKKGSKVAQ
jgi:hypothetical protein